jgi:thiamine biosynthesis lipoprotein
MGSPCELLAATDSESLARQLLDVASADAWRVEDKFSRYLPGNIIARINSSNGAPIEVDDETADLLDFAETLHQLSDGLFDITSGILGKLWRFDGGDRIPDAGDVKSMLTLVGWAKLDWSRPILTLPPGMQIDLGGLGKEYAVDRAGILLAAQTEAGCLVNYGGDLVATGCPDGSTGWRVGIEQPDDRPAAAGQVIRLAKGGLATSGDARRYLKKNGVRYGHILNPATGWPIEGAPRSVTVAADSCTQAGMLATLAMLNGTTAEAFLDEQDVRYWCLR